MPPGTPIMVRKNATSMVAHPGINDRYAAGRSLGNNPRKVVGPRHVLRLHPGNLSFGTDRTDQDRVRGAVCHVSEPGRGRRQAASWQPSAGHSEREPEANASTASRMRIVWVVMIRWPYIDARHRTDVVPWCGSDDDRGRWWLVDVHHSRRSGRVDRCLRGRLLDFSDEFIADAALAKPHEILDRQRPSDAALAYHLRDDLFIESRTHQFLDLIDFQPIDGARLRLVDYRGRKWFRCRVA